MWRALQILHSRSSLGAPGVSSSSDVSCAGERKKNLHKEIHNRGEAAGTRMIQRTSGRGLRNTEVRSSSLDTVALSETIAGLQSATRRRTLRRTTSLTRNSLRIGADCIYLIVVARQLT